MIKLLICCCLILISFSVIGEAVSREEIHFKKTLRHLNNQIKRCNLSENKKLTFDEMYDLLFKLHFKIQVNGSAGYFQGDYGCKGYDQELTCILNKKFRKSLNKAVNDKGLMTYWRRHAVKKIDDEEIQLKINYLKHLVEGDHRGEGNSER